MRIGQRYCLSPSTTAGDVPSPAAGQRTLPLRHGEHGRDQRALLRPCWIGLHLEFWDVDLPGYFARNPAAPAVQTAPQDFYDELRPVNLHFGYRTLRAV